MVKGIGVLNKLGVNYDKYCTEANLIGEGGTSSVYIKEGFKTVIKCSKGVSYREEYGILESLYKGGCVCVPKPIKYINDNLIEVEYIEGKLYTEYIYNEIDKSIKYLKGIIGSIIDIQEQGYIVEDIHSDNIIVGKDDKIYIIDVENFKKAKGKESNRYKNKVISGVYLKNEIADELLKLYELSDNIDNPYTYCDDYLYQIGENLVEFAKSKGYILEHW